MIDGYCKSIVRIGLVTTDPNFDIAEENPYTNDLLSGRPLTWSHAAFVATVQTWLKAHNRFSSKN